MKIQNLTKSKKKNENVKLEKYKIIMYDKENKKNNCKDIKLKYQK